MLIGYGLLLISGLGFTGSMLLANLATKNGIDIHTSNFVRYGTAVILLLIWHHLKGDTFRIAPRERYTAIGLGIPVFLMGAGYLGATQYIPISLAVLIFYTGPFYIMIVARFTEKEPITLLRICAISVAFIGLALALDVRSDGSLHLLGISFALLAAFGMATYVTVSSLAIRSAPPQTVNLYSLAGGSLLFGLFFMLHYNPAIVTTTSALGLLLASGLSVTIAYMSYFYGLQRIGPVRASLLLNSEPVFTLVLASLLLGEFLSGTQLIGASLVIAGIVLISLK